MVNDNRWRFPGNNFTKDEGLDTADMETFKKDFLSSLARELCQNTIDARRDDNNKPARIVFKSFEISKYDIPQREAIEKQIKACQETWKGKIHKQLLDMEKEIKKDKIVCLRVSDFNTKGLVGVNLGGDDTSWHNLIHGSGISDKGGSSGGSKGIGKYATFVASSINTVFYSTKTIKDEEGFEGICKLCSAKQEGTDEKTLGIGYYGADDKNKPIPCQLFLDPSFQERNESGTDIYIIGFKNETNWKQSVVSKVLESFISAIMFDNLEVEVDGTVLNKANLKDIVFNDDLIRKEHKKSIVSQYLLLTSEDRMEDIITVDGYGDVTLYLLELEEEYEKYATNKVVMIRYPFMKIKDSQKVTTLPCSAMCIIGDNALNRTFRDVENPQHTDWEFKRINDESVRSEVINVYQQLMQKIQATIADHLSSSNNTKTDLEGAGEYLPGVDEQPSKHEEEERKVIQDKPVHHKEQRIKTTNPNASIETDDGDGVSLDFGGVGVNEEVLTPEGQNNGKGGPVKPGIIKTEGGTGEDGPIIAKHAQLRSMRYRMICLNKAAGKYVVIFTSDFNEPESTLYLFALDEGGNKYPVQIKEAKVNGVIAELDENNGVKFALEHGKKYKVEMITDQTELFSGEVKVYAYR